MLRIYTLSSTKNPNEIRYVGKTIKTLQQRLSLHLSSAKRYRKDNIYTIHNYNWINHELENGYDIIISLVEEIDIPTNYEWKWIEQYWISLFKAWGFNLTNLTSGGDGNQNLIFSKESIEKKRLKLIGKPRPEEVKLKISKSHQGKKLTLTHKLHVKEAIVNLLGKTINLYNLKGEYIKTWKCIKDAAMYYNLDSGNIIKCCNRHPAHSTCGSFIWRYENDELPILLGITKKFILLCSLNGDIINVWNSIMEASNKLNFSYSLIYRCCKGYKNNYNNFIWKYSQ